MLLLFLSLRPRSAQRRPSQPTRCCAAEPLWEEEREQMEHLRYMAACAAQVDELKALARPPVGTLAAAAGHGGAEGAVAEGASDLWDEDVESQQHLQEMAALDASVTRLRGIASGSRAATAPLRAARSPTRHVGPAMALPPRSTASVLTRRSAVAAAAAAVAAAAAGRAAAASPDGGDGATEPPRGALDVVFEGYRRYLASPALQLERGGPYMSANPLSGDAEFSYPITGARQADGAPLLVFGFLATRGGGIFPDELPFNIFQKILRRVLPDGAIPDYPKGDYRRQFQDTWYGTNEKADLPFGLNANAEEEGLPEGAGPLQGELEASSGAAGGAASDQSESDAE